MTRQLTTLLGSTVQFVGSACMERREGSEFDFNDPLLAHALDHYAISSGVVVVALLFLSEGRHAGANGDIEEIVADLRLRHPHVDIRVTSTIGTHPLVAEILKDRFQQALQTPPLTLASAK